MWLTLAVPKLKQNYGFPQQDSGERQKVMEAVSLDWKALRSAPKDLDLITAISQTTTTHPKLTKLCLFGSFFQEVWKMAQKIPHLVDLLFLGL